MELEKYLQKKFIISLKEYANRTYMYTDCSVKEWKEYDERKNRYEDRKEIRLLAEMLRDNNIFPFSVEGLRNERESWRFEFNDVAKQDMEWVWSNMIKHHMPEYEWGEPGSYNFDMNVCKLAEILERAI